MPRYFFHVEYDGLIHDDEGAELRDLTVAKCEAVKLAGQMICDAAGEFWEKDEWKLTATNEDGLTLFALHFIGVDAPAAGGRDPNLISARPIEPA
jgi:hypothetical protein